MKICHLTSAHGEKDVRIYRKECISLSNAGYEVFLVERGKSCEENDVHIIGAGKVPTNRIKRSLGKVNCKGV